jgi:dTDP-4-dehydrorhamnose reductase
MQKSKLIITGSQGFIGGHLYRDLKNQIPVYTAARKVVDQSEQIYFDLENPSVFNYSFISPNDLIVHLAAISSPDVCSKNTLLAKQVNQFGAIDFLEGCLSRGAKVIFFSSDTVYGEANTCFDELSPCHPLGDYGVMKHAVEKVFLGRDNIKIFRLAYVFSCNDKFSLYLSKCAAEDISADIFHPFFRNTVYVKDIVSAIYTLYKYWNDYPHQIVNIGGEKLMSRLCLANQYKEKIFPNLKMNIIDPGAAFFQHRPRSISMNVNRFSHLLGRAPTPIDHAIEMDFKRG